MNIKQWFKQDKLLHFIAGQLIALIVFFFSDSIVFALIVTAAIGAIKELYDSDSETHTADFKDFIATVAGGVFLVVVVLIC